MCLRVVCTVFVLTSAVCDVIVQNRTKERCGIETSQNAHPWLVGIEFELSKSDYSNMIVTEVKCTGALINRRNVVSNADCFGVKEEAKSVRFQPNITTNGITCPGGSSGEDCTDDGATRLPIESVVLHPEFSKTLNWSATGEKSHDIALIRLRDAVLYTDFIRPVCLPSTDVKQIATTDRDLHLAGIYYDVPFEYTLESLGESMIYLNKKEYAETVNSKLLVAEDYICAMKTKHNMFIPFACMLVGGLLMNKSGNTYELVGLLEMTNGCFNVKLFTHVYLYVDWITSITPEWTPCGRPRVNHVELIVNAEFTKAGDWPWHVAIYRLIKSTNKYTCGGTLITKTMVLTAAHCTTVSGIPVNPEILSVILGKYYLIGANIEAQEIQVQSVIVHENYLPGNYLENDIALLKLQTEAIYSDYVQPACVWYSEVYGRLTSTTIFGTVVGWGFDESDALSSQLKQSKMPKVRDATCIQKNPLFYSNVLSNHKKFCAGWANGTSPCNGDSGGGFLVFVPDTGKADSADAPGSWYIRGIVSMTASLKNYARCDPYQYVVFTDIDKYTDWIKRHVDN